MSPRAAVVVTTLILAIVPWAGRPVAEPWTTVSPVPVPAAAAAVRDALVASPRPLPAIPRLAPERALSDRAARPVDRGDADPSADRERAERPGWPADWPSPDGLPANGSPAATQMMGSGDFDIDLPGSTEVPSGVDGGADEGVPVYEPSYPVSDDEPDEETEEEVDEGLDRLGEMIRERLGEDAEDDPFGEPPPPAPDGDPERLRTVPREPPAEGEEGVSGEAGAGNPSAPPAALLPPGQTPGYRLFGPDGEPLDSVVLGQEFRLELHLRPEDASIPGRAGGTREYRHLDVTLKTGNGEETVRLYRQEELSPGGLVRFATREPISLGGQWGKNVFETSLSTYEGTEDLGLELDETGGRDLVRVVVDGVVGGFGTFRVYGDRLQQAMGILGETIDTVEDYLQAQRAAAERILADPAVAGDERMRDAMRGVLDRTDQQLEIVRSARNFLVNQDSPRRKFEYARQYLGLVVAPGDYGLEIKETAPTLDEKEEALHRAETQASAKIGQSLMNAIEAYLVGTYSTFAHVTLIAPLGTIYSAFYRWYNEGEFQGVDEFGRDAPVGWALVEVGIGVVAMKLPGVVIEYLASGGRIGFEIGVGRATGGPRVGRRPGEVAATTNQGRSALPTGIRPRGALPGETVAGAAAGGARIPGAPGRPGREIAAGERPEPGSSRRGGGVDEETRQFWREKEYSEADAPLSGEDLGPEFTDRYLGEMDVTVNVARQRGVPEAVIDQALADSRRMPNARDAAEFVGTRLELEITTRERGRVFASQADKVELQFEGSATAEQLEQVTVIDTGVLDAVVAKSQLEASGRPQTWTIEEIEYGRAIARRLEAGEDLSGWKSVDFAEGPGVRPLFGSDDLGAIRSTFVGRPLRIVAETGAPTPTTQVGAAPGARPAPEPAARPGAVDRGAPTEGVGRVTERVAPPERPADTQVMTPAERAAAVERTTPREPPAPEPPDGADAFGPGAPRPGAAAPEAGPRPLSSLDEYRAMVARQEAGEIVDLTGVARPGIAEVTEAGIGVRQGAGRWEATRPDEWLDLFVPEGTKLPDGVEVQVLETGIPAEVVRQSNLLSSRGQAGTNPRIVDLAAGRSDSWTRIRVRARDVRAPTSRVAAEIRRELATLREQGADVDALADAIEDLAPAERLRVLRDPEARAEALGATRTSPSTVVDPVVDPTALGGPSGVGETAGVEVLIRSKGGSTGSGVLEVFAANHGERPVRIRGLGLVLRPVELDEQEKVRVDEILDAATSGKPLPPPEGGDGDDRTVLGGWRRGAGPAPFPASWRRASVVRVELEGYCLEYAGGVPTEGVVFRIADPETQAAHAPTRAILASSRAMLDAGELHPDTDPEAYFHSIRQWAIWIDENGFDRAGFEAAFTAHARRNLEAAGRAWDDRTEGVVRSLVPGRWEDLVAVLRRAGRPPAAAGTSP